MKAIIQKLLIRKAKKVVRACKPKVVAITGSVGKTSTRNAIAAVLGGSMSVRMARENYNNEFGVPLTILGALSPGRSIFGWLRLLFTSVDIKTYPSVLVLEYGADKPGDINFLCDIAVPDVAVFTAVSHVHVENYKSIEELQKEKATLIGRLKSDGLAVLNADDERVFNSKSETQAKVVTYGFSEFAQVRAQNDRLVTREDFSFEPGEVFSTLTFDLSMQGGDHGIEICLFNHIGRPSISAALAAVAVGAHFGLSLEVIMKNLRVFEPQNGRMQPIAGIKGSLILDDSYNAAPSSMRAAVETLKSFAIRESARRIAALGHMAELGQYSEGEHRRLGEQVAKLGIDVLITAGEMARDIARGALASGMKAEQMIECADSTDAGRKLDQMVKQGDIVLVKGSQSARMERAVKDIMAQPLLASRLLVRQYGKWLE